MSGESLADLEIATGISQFLKLPQKSVQAIRIVYEPLMDYSQSQILTSDQHIDNMEDIAKKKA